MIDHPTLKATAAGLYLQASTYKSLHKDLFKANLTQRFALAMPLVLGVFLVWMYMGPMYNSLPIYLPEIMTVVHLACAGFSAQLIWHIVKTRYVYRRITGAADKLFVNFVRCAPDIGAQADAEAEKMRAEAITFSNELHQRILKARSSLQKGDPPPSLATLV